MKLTKNQLKKLIQERIRSESSFLDFFGIEDSGEPSPPSESMLWSELPRDTLFSIGGKKPMFRIFKSEGLVKYATIHGSAGRKFYQIRPESLEPLLVAAFEATEGGASTKPTSISAPGKPVTIGKSETGRNSEFR